MFKWLCLDEIKTNAWFFGCLNGRDGKKHGFWMDVFVVFCLDVAYVESRDICRMMGSNNDMDRFIWIKERP